MIDLGVRHGFGMTFEPVATWLGWAASLIDVLSILLLLIGAARFVVWMVRAELFSAGGDQRLEGQNLARLELGRYILAGLELLIVADVIHTALSLTIESILFLGALVLIRSAISWFLDRELSRLQSGATTDAPQ